MAGSESGQCRYALKCPSGNENPGPESCKIRACVGVQSPSQVSSVVFCRGVSSAGARSAGTFAPTLVFLVQDTSGFGEVYWTLWSDRDSRW
jgi:hypothetical protein